MKNSAAVAGTFTVVGLIIAVIVIAMAKVVQAQRRMRSQNVQGGVTQEIEPFPNRSASIATESDPPGYVESMQPQDNLLRSLIVEIKARRT